MLNSLYPQNFYTPYTILHKKTAPRSGFHVLATLILLSVVRFDGFGLDDHRRVASGEGAAFGGDGSGDIAGRQSESHGDSRGDGQR